MEAVLFKCRLVAKRAGTWRCDHCQTKITQLHRGFGQWPVDTFAKLTSDEQRSFFASVRSGSGADAVSKMTELLDKYESHESFYENSGEFLPLSVWACRGFDPAVIQARSQPKDVQQHAVLGEVFRVKILQTGGRGTEGTRRLETLKAGAKKQKTEAVAVAAAATAAAVQAAVLQDSSEGDKSDSDSSESESSSSSSSDSRKKSKDKKKKDNKKKDKKSKDKKKRKDKKNKDKKKKEPEVKKSKEDLAKEREDAAKDKALKALATSVLTKLVPALNSLSTTMAKPESLHLPVCVTDAVAAQNRILQNLDKECKLVLAGGGSQLSVASAKELTKIISEAKKTETVMNHMLATMNKLQ